MLTRWRVWIEWWYTYNGVTTDIMVCCQNIEVTMTWLSGSFDHSRSLSDLVDKNRLLSGCIYKGRPSSGCGHQVRQCTIRSDNVLSDSFDVVFSLCWLDFIFMIFCLFQRQETKWYYLTLHRSQAGSTGLQKLSLQIHLTLQTQG